MAGMDHPFGDAARQVPLSLHDRPELDRKGAVGLLRVAADQPVRGRRAGAAQDPPMVGVGGAHRQTPLSGLSTQRLGEFGARMTMPMPVEVSGRSAENRLEGLELPLQLTQRRLAPIRAARLPLGELQMEPQLGSRGQERGDVQRPALDHHAHGVNGTRGRRLDDPLVVARAVAVVVGRDYEGSPLRHPEKIARGGDALPMVTPG